jgi:hypothetical protein
MRLLDGDFQLSNTIDQYCFGQIERWLVFDRGAGIHERRSLRSASEEIEGGTIAHAFGALHAYIKNCSQQSNIDAYRLNGH